MSVLDDIEFFKGKLSTTELKLANFILNNTEEVPTMTSNEIAKKSGVSPAAVIRFSNKLGYDKFADFRIAISKSVTNRVHNEYSNISFNNSFQVTKNDLIHNYKLIFDSISDMMQEKMIDQVVNLLSEKNKIYVYGVGSSSLIAEDIRQKWSRLGKTVIFDKDTSILRQQIINDKETSLFFGISHSGNNREVVSLLKSAKQNNMPTLVLTQVGQNEAKKIADFLIQTPRTDYIDNGHYGSGATHSILIQFLTIDIVYFFYIKKAETL